MDTSHIGSASLFLVAHQRKPSAYTEFIAFDTYLGPKSTIEPKSNAWVTVGVIKLPFCSRNTKIRVSVDLVS